MLEIDDNILDKVLIHNLFHDYQFVKRQNIGPFSSDIKEVYAKYFTKGDIKVAREKLEGGTAAIGKEDLLFIGLFGGATVMMFLFLIYYAT